jgi:hypothetical protein
MGRDFKSHEGGVQDPAKHDLPSFPVGVTFQEFLHGGGFLAAREIIRLKRMKDLINYMQEHATDLALTTGIALNQSEVVVHVDVIGGEDLTLRLHMLQKGMDARRGPGQWSRELSL